MPTTKAHTQRTLALQEADRIRSWRGQLRRDLHALHRTASMLRVADILEVPPAEVLTMPCHQLIRLARGAGQSTLQTVALTTHADLNRQVGQCGPETRARIAGVLRRIVERAR